jgi:hypothetical protein
MEKTSLQGLAMRRSLPIWLADLDGWASVALLAVAVALFAPLQIIGDGGEYYGLVARLFGDTNHAFGWVFGLALMNAPFYAIGKLLSTLGLHSIEGHPTTEALVSLAGSAYMLLAAAIVARMLGILRLPYRTFVVLAAVIGSPLLYYGLFLPGGTHRLRRSSSLPLLACCSLPPAGEGSGCRSPAQSGSSWDSQRQLGIRFPRWSSVSP